MGRTLFWYVFKDLFKIFALTNGALSGIMSFGGLLRPLTQQGLDASQVVQMLMFLSPAMTAYSLPIAALFAATVVYGRLSADNELTACRAGGISLGPMFGMALPALLFGLVVAILSLVLLCFIVPTYTLKVERVIYSNLAKLIANRIERTHEVRFAGANIFAQRAYIPPPDPNDPNRQVVVLEGVAIFQYEKPTVVTSAATRPSDRPAGEGDETALATLPGGGAGIPGIGGKSAPVPKDFLLASSATIEIREREDDQVSLVIALEGGTKFPREFRGGTQMAVEATQFGPLEMPSPVKEDVKFMDVWKLQDLYRKPEQSRVVARYTGELGRREQIRRFLEQIRDELASPTRLTWLVDPGTGTKVKLVRLPQSPLPVVQAADGELALTGTTPATITYERYGGGTGADLSVQSARQLRLRARPDNARGVMSVTVELLERSPGADGSRAVSGNYSSVIEVPMSDELKGLVGRKVDAYGVVAQRAKADRVARKAQADAIDAQAALETDPARAAERRAAAAKLRAESDRRSQEEKDWDVLRRELVVLNNNILAESNARASFAVSCLILVLVGAALGMMFRSGNFLTAFAVSFVPALVCITLIVAGQQMCHAVPMRIDSQPNPLKYGIAFIWSGNVVNFAIAATLLWRLQRQ
jgi:lipopolysaccharide export LptBFGC system permease protein LptF